MDPTPYYGPYRVKVTAIVIPLGTVTPLCEENFNRVALIIGTNGAQAVAVGTRSNILPTTAIGLTLNGVSFLEIRFSDYGPLVGQAWFANAQGAANAEVIEIIRDREIGEKWQLIPELQSAEPEPQDVFDPLRELGGDGAVQQ